MWEVVKVVLWTMALAVLTAAISWLGVMGWDGESGGNLWLLLLGLPLWGCGIGLIGIEVHPVPAFTVGAFAHFCCCLVPVTLVRLIVRIVRRGKTPASTVGTDKDAREQEDR